MPPVAWGWDFHSNGTLMLMILPDIEDDEFVEQFGVLLVVPAEGRVLTLPRDKVLSFLAKITRKDLSLRVVSYTRAELEAERRGRVQRS
jgi:hypothetical protein